MSSKNYKVSDTRERILEAALNLFSENGFHATTTRKIAQRADVNEVTLFRLFKSKMDLFKEILQQVRRVGLDADDLVGRTMEPEEAVRYVVLNMLETLETHPLEYRILQHAILDEVEGFENEFIIRNLTMVQEFLIKAFEVLQQEGKVHTHESPEIMAALLITSTTGVVNGRILMKKAPFHKLDREALCEHIINLFLVQKG
ncbi:MAG: TetR/AcrR family transcriptional regulator [Proteobacteria bacterium]|nr:TetR/AcrR family transcriptional regulator [Pseudomonadota bacterium]